MDREVAELERRLAESPEDGDLLRAAVRAHRRAGSRARALSLIERFLEFHPDAELRERREALLEEGNLAESRRPRRIADGEKAVLCLAFDMDEARLAAGHAGGSVKIWSTVPGREGERLLTLDAHRRSTPALMFSPGGTLVTGGGDGRVRTWDLEARRALRVLKGIGSRPVLVDMRGDVLEGQWRGLGYRRLPGSKKEEEYITLLPNLHLPHLDFAARNRRETRVFRRIQELIPDLERQKLSHSRRFLWASYRPYDDHRYAVVTDPMRTTIGVVFSGGMELMDPETRPLAAFRDERIQPPRGYETDQAPAFALAPKGRAALLGSPSNAGVSPTGFFRAPGRKAPTGALLLIPGEEPRLEVLVPDAVITAAAVSPSGGLAALGTKNGDVYMFPLFPGRAAPPEVGAPEREVLEVAALGDLTEAEDAPAPTLEGYARLRTLGGRELPIAVKYIRFDRDLLWLYPARTKPADGEDGVRSPAYEAVQVYDLRGGNLTTYPFVIHHDGLPYRHEVRSRWLVMTEVIYHPAPPGEQGPGLPPESPKAGKIPGKKAVEEALGVKTRDWVPSPAGGLYAVRAVKRPREFWLVDPERPDEARHFPSEDAITKLVFSPGGTRLAALGRRGSVELYGIPPDYMSSS